MIDLFCAAAGVDRRDHALEVLSTTDAAVVLAPRRSVADELVWDLAHTGRATAALERTTPMHLAAELAGWALAREGRVAVGDTAARAVLARVVDRVLGERSLRWFGDVAQLPGFVPSLQRTMQELRMAGVSGADLERLAGPGRLEDEPSEIVRSAHLRLLRGAAGVGASRVNQSGGTEERRRVLAELGALCLAYEDELADWGLADRAWHLARATEVVLHGDSTAEEVREGLLSPWRDRAQLWFDVALHSPLERDFFRAVAALAPRVTVVCPARDRQTLRAVGGQASHRTEDSEPLGSDPVSDLRRVQQRVFAPSVAPPKSTDASDDSFAFFSAAGEGQEAVEVARRALALADEGVAFDDMAILVRQPGAVLPLVEDALGRAGIPAYFARGNTRPDPSGRAFLALLSCAAEDLSASAFAEYLSFDQVPSMEESIQPPTQGSSDSPEQVHDVPWVAPSGDQLVLKSLVAAGEAEEENVEPAVTSRSVVGADPPQEAAPEVRVAPGRWERILVDAAVVGGADRWRRRLRGLRAELERRIEEAGDESEGRRRALIAKRAHLKHLERFALPILERLDQLPEGGSWGTWIDRLERLAVQALRWPRSVLEVLAQLRPMSPVEGVSLRQVLSTLEEPLRDLQTQPPKRRQGRIFVGAIEQARGRTFRVVFLPGLAEGVFPARASEDPLLLDRERRRISGMLDPDSSLDVAAPEEVSDPDDPLLPVQSTRLHRERLLLRLALGAASERLFVSYPRIDSMLGRARVPSFYALDILRAAEGRLPDLEGLASRAAASGASGVAWPAPERPEQAIDDAEFDLALLHPSQKESGAARFLLFANEHLARSLHARARRWRRPFTWADGLVAADAPMEHRDEVARILADQRPSARSYSPTALQHFAACPYRFLLQAIHRLRAEEDRTGLEQLDPLTRGSLFHEIQFRLFRRLRDQGALPIREANLADAIECADQVLDEVADQTYEEIAPAIDRIWNAEIDSLRNDLRGWLRLVAESGGWEPVMAELSFGLPLDGGHDEASVADPVEVHGALFRGSIDLVERLSSGERPVFRVTDHKTGRASAKPGTVIAGGTVLQPTIYALVLESMLRDGRIPTDIAAKDGEGVEVQAGRLDYCTVKGGFQTVEVPLNLEARDAVQAVLDGVDSSIRDGFLPAAPQEGACRYCDYRAVCGPYEERRIQRKRQEPLRDLIALRRRR